MKTEDLLKKLKEVIRKHEPITVNYGKGYFSDDDVVETAYWDESINRYRDSTGIWSTELLFEIARGEVEDTKIVLEEDSK